MTSADRGHQSKRNWTLITVTYNSARVLESSWRGVDLNGIRWIVVDNDSRDNSADIAAGLGAEVIRRDVNAGFSSSNNMAFEQVTSPYTAFVNPDVTIDASSLTRLARLAEHNHALVSPQLTYPDGSHQANARGIPTPVAKFANRGFTPPWHDPGQYARTHLDGPTYVAWLMGAAVCGRTDDFRRIGAWDDDFFIYYEDHDLGLRAWQLGLSVVLDSASTWIHEWQRETTSFSRTAWTAELQSARRFYRKYPDLWSAGRASRSPRFSKLLDALWSPALDI